MELLLGLLQQKIERGPLAPEGLRDTVVGGTDKTSYFILCEIAWCDFHLVNLYMVTDKIFRLKYKYFQIFQPSEFGIEVIIQIKFPCAAVRFYVMIPVLRAAEARETNSNKPPFLLRIKVQFI